jgi:peptidyl-prolyl cis-trans isomerase C
MMPHTKPNLLRRGLKASLPLLFLALVLVFAAAQAETAATEEDPIVLRSETRTVSLSDFEARFQIAIATVLAQQGQMVTPEVLAQLEGLRPQFLDDLAFQFALLDEAERRGFEVPEEAVEGQLEAARMGFETEEAFTEALQEAGFRDEAQFREIIREGNLIQQAVAALQEEVEVGEEEVQSFYEENQELFERPEEVCARHILVETEEEIEEIAEALEAGEDFAELAQERSMDPGSAVQGGDLGCQPRGVYVPPFEEAAFTTPLDTVSEPVETQFGYHLILPYERVEAGVAELDEVRENIRQELQREGLNESVVALRDEADIEVFEEHVMAPVDPTETEREPLVRLQQAANDLIDQLLEHEQQLSVEREDLEELQERLNEIVDGVMANGVQRESVEELQNVVNDVFDAVREDLPENAAAEAQPAEGQDLTAQAFSEPLESLREAANDLIDQLMEQEGHLVELGELQERLNEVIDGVMANGVQRESVEELQNVVNSVFDAVLEDLDDNEEDEMQN